MTGSTREDGGGAVSCIRTKKGARQAASRDAGQTTSGEGKFDYASNVRFKGNEPDIQLATKLAELGDYKTLLLERSSLTKAEFILKLSESTPFENEAELKAWIKRTESDIRRKQRKILGDEVEPEDEPVFPLLDRPDEELNEEELKEKKRQRLMKAGYEARVKVREEKKKIKERQVEAAYSSHRVPPDMISGGRKAKRGAGPEDRSFRVVDEAESRARGELSCLRDRLDADPPAQP